MNAPIVFVPGFLGSRLSGRGLFGLETEIWPDVVNLAIGNYQPLRLTQNQSLGGDLNGPRASGVFWEPYSPFYLWANSQGYDVFGFAYDWRRTVEHNATSFAMYLLGFLSRFEKCHIVAHSMGGLVASGALNLIQSSVAERVERVVTVGTPWAGSYSAIRALCGLDTEALSLEWFGNAFGRFLGIRRNESLLGVMSSWDGILDLLPTPELMTLEAKGSYPDPFKIGTWFGANSYLDQERLDRALVRIQARKTVPLSVPWTNVVGFGHETVGPVKEGDTLGQVAFNKELQGDSVVPIQSAWPTFSANLTTRTFSGTHTLLCAYPAFFAILQEALKPILK